MKIEIPLKIKISILAILLIFCADAAWAKSEILKNWRGWAVKGYDVVAYFTQGQPVKGSKEIEYRWKDAIWRFANAEHLAAFKADPEKYAPQYGGY